MASRHRAVKNEIKALEKELARLLAKEEGLATTRRRLQLQHVLVNEW